MKKPKVRRKVEERTVFILSCDGRYALEKRPDTGLLAGLWQFPNVSGYLDTSHAIEAVEGMGIRVRDIRRQSEKKHIFTHIQWEMRGFYMETATISNAFAWMTADEIEEKAALPTAFRQFWEDKNV